MNSYNKKYLSVDQINDAIIEINKKLTLSKWIPDVIISLNRGGCVPGVYLSHLINAVSYTHLTLPTNREV